jgi:hypothetical protein
MSYYAVKSAAVMTGCCLVQLGSTTHAPTSPLATLAHVGAPGEAEGWGVG